MKFSKTSDLLLPCRRFQTSGRLRISDSLILRLAFLHCRLGAPTHARLRTLLANRRLVHRLEWVVKASVVEIGLTVGPIVLPTFESSCGHFQFQIRL